MIKIKLALCSLNKNKQVKLGWMIKINLALQLIITVQKLSAGVQIMLGGAGSEIMLGSIVKHNFNSAVASPSIILVHKFSDLQLLNQE